MTDTVQKMAIDSQRDLMNERLTTYEDTLKAARKELLDYNSKVGKIFKLTRNNELLTRVGNAENDLHNFKRSFDYLGNLDENLNHLPQAQ